MTITKKLIHAVFAGVLAMGVCTTALADKQGRNTIIGAGLGGAAGALISEGDPWVILGGAAAGGVLGHVITDDDDRHRRHRDWNRGHRSNYKHAGFHGKNKHRGKHSHKRHHHRH